MKMMIIVSGGWLPWSPYTQTYLCCSMDLVVYEALVLVRKAGGPGISPNPDDDCLVNVGGGG